MYQTLLFGMDGTLIDSAEGVFYSLYYAMESAGGSELLRSEVRHFLGSPLRQVLRERFGCEGETLRRIEECYAAHYREHGLYQTVPAPGMVELTTRCFEAVAGSYHNGVPEEKSAVIREALRLLNAPANTALMIGDRAADVYGARACGIPCIGIDFCGYADPGELEQAGALAVVHTAEELECFLNSKHGPGKS